MCPDWPLPPIWPEDLPLIRELLTPEECAALLRRTVQVLPNGPLLDRPQARPPSPDTHSPYRLSAMEAWWEKAGNPQGFVAFVGGCAILAVLLIVLAATGFRQARR